MRAAFVIAVASLSISACSGELTEIIVVTDTDLPESRIDGVRFVVRAIGGARSHQRDAPLTDVDRPATLGLVPDGDPNGRIRVEAIGLLGGEEIPLRRSARTQFAEGRVLVLELPLLAECDGVTCAVDQTCVAGGACETDAVPPESLRDWNGSPPRIDAGQAMHDGGAPSDGSAPDGDVDAGACVPEGGSEVSCDGMDDDCDGTIDEGFDLSGSEADCGECGRACAGTSLCTLGLCENESIAVAAGWAHSCATGTGGTPYCWGDGADGRLGSATAESLMPLAVPGTPAVRKLAAGEAHSCALTLSGDVWCWGDDAAGALGDGAASTGPGPVMVDFPVAGNVVDLTAGREHVCAALADGTAWCWGKGDKGQLGDGATGDRTSPTLVTDLSEVTSVSAGLVHTCAVTAGEVRCWGENTVSQLGISATGVRAAPQPPVAGLSGVVQVAAGGEFTCALRNDGAILCWGRNGSGELGDGTTTSTPTPRAVMSPTDATAPLRGALWVAAGSEHACAVMLGGRVACWGSEERGQLGRGSTSPRSVVPVWVSGITGVTRVAAGLQHTCAIARDGATVWCWGDNTSGQLGDGTTMAHHAPEPVTF